MAEDKTNKSKVNGENSTQYMNDFAPAAPQLTEQLATTSEEPKISGVDYIYNSIKAKANQPSLLQQIDGVKKDSDYFSSMFKPAEPEKVSFNEERINVKEAYTQLSDGSYITRYDEGYLKGADNEQMYAENQRRLSPLSFSLSVVCLCLPPSLL